MTTHSNPAQMRHSFFSLPGEVRNEIYEWVFLVDGFRFHDWLKEKNSHTRGVDPPPKELRGSVTLLQLNRCIYREASAILHRLPRIIDCTDRELPVRKTLHEGQRYARPSRLRNSFTELQFVSFKNIIVQVWDSDKYDRDKMGSLNLALRMSKGLQTVCFYFIGWSVRCPWETVFGDSDFKRAVVAWAQFFGSVGVGLKKPIDVWIYLQPDSEQPCTCRIHSQYDSESIDEKLSSLSEGDKAVRAALSRGREREGRYINIRPLLEQAKDFPKVLFNTVKKTWQPSRLPDLTPECRECFQIFMTRGQLFDHLADHKHNKKPRTFTGERGYVYPLDEHKIEDRESKRCLRCGKLFNTKSNLFHHIKKKDHAMPTERFW